MHRLIARALPLLLACGIGLVATAHADESEDIMRMYSIGQRSEAFAQLDKLLAERPKDAQLRFTKGVLLERAGLGTEAQAVYEQLNIDYPDMPEAYNNLAVIYAARGDYDRARAALEGALRALPAYAVAQQNLGDVHVQLARIAYARAFQLDPASTALSAKLAALRPLTHPAAAASPASAASSP